MEELIDQTNFPSGPKRYIFNNQVISVAPYFIYEVSLHKYWKGGYCYLGNKLYKSGQILHISKSVQVQKFKDYTLSKEVILLGAPEGFIKEMGLPIFVPEINEKKHGTRRSTKRPIH